MPMPWSATDRRTTSRAGLAPVSRWWVPVDSSPEPLVRLMSDPHPVSPWAPSGPVLAAAGPDATVPVAVAEPVDAVDPADMLPVIDVLTVGGPDPPPVVTTASSR